MKKTLPFLVLFTAIVVLASCSKEKMTERKITRKDGEWVIKKLNIRTYEEIEPGTSFFMLYDNYGYANCGTMAFDKSSNVTINLDLDGEKHVETGKWSNGTDNITIIDDSTTRMFKIKEINRKELQLTYRYDYTIDGYDYYQESTYEMERN